MFPSPSDGPPLLSLSASPAFGPWGMPFELDPDEAPPDELDVCVAGLEDWVDELPLDEFDPQAATPRATSTNRAAARRRVDLVIVGFIVAPLCHAAWNRGYDVDVCARQVVPGR
jgi:hypothetical protein